MLRGVMFVGNSEDLFLNLESAMDIDGYDWYIDDIYGNDYREGRYSAQELRNALTDIAWFSFIRVRRYQLGASIERIMTYEEYVESACDVFILFYDGGYCQIYSKREDITQNFYKLALEHGFEEVEYVNDENDSRTGMCY